jgi:hypothetical protein
MITEKNYHRVKSFLDDDTRMDEAKKLLQKPLAKLLLLMVLLVALVYASKYVFNGAAHSVNAFKNLRDALAR